MAEFEPYADEVCAESINSFQERLVEADNLKKDDNGMMNYEICWKAMRQEGPMILNVAKQTTRSATSDEPKVFITTIFSKTVCQCRTRQSTYHGTRLSFIICSSTPCQ